MKLNSILLVEDDPAANLINMLLIEEMDIADRILVATNGEEALHMIKQYNEEHHSCPDLILLDINMPYMDGIEFLEHFKKIDFKDKESVVIIMLTTSLHKRDIERIKVYKVSDYLNKPITGETMKRILDNHFMNKKKAERA